MDENKTPPTISSSLVSAGNSKDKVSESKGDATAVPTEPMDVKPSRSSYVRMVQNFRLVWLDESTDEINNEYYRNKVTKLRQVINTVNTFTDVDECIDFITEITEENVFLISSGVFGQTAASVAHDMSQVSAIYIFCRDKGLHEQWATQWPKVKGVFSDINHICEVLKQAAQDCDRNAVVMSFIAPSSGRSAQNLDQLNQSFMYTQILKEILLTIDFEQGHFMQFISYCRELLVDNIAELSNVDKLEREYRAHDPIWSYTCNCLLYSMLNRVLRTMEIDLIIKMGFFVRHLHESITKLHSAQYADQSHSASFTVYRGQGLSQTDFAQLMKTQGGLMSFNNFLSTSLDREVSLVFAESNQVNPDLIGVLFQITIDPSIPSIPFANIRTVSHFQGEEEILFSMHSIFRIEQIQPMDNSLRLYQVDLILTSDADPQLRTLTECMRKETFLGQKGWLRLGMLLIRLGLFDKAQEVYDILLDQTANEGEKASLYHMLGTIKDSQGKYAEAVAFYEKSQEIIQKTGPVDLSKLAASYNNIGSAYEKMDEYYKALAAHESALKIGNETLNTWDPRLATSHNNIGLVYEKMGEYSKALFYSEKALEIYQHSLPENHPDLANSYNNIGGMYREMGEYSKALLSHEKALNIQQKTLPPIHPSLVNTYSNISTAYHKMGEYSKAISSNEKALQIQQSILPVNDPSLAASSNNSGVLYSEMGEYSKALSYFEEALKIWEKTLPANHSNFATSYSNIGLVYEKMGECSKALSSHEKALETRQKTLPENHPDLATSYSNIGSVYDEMGEHSKALSYYEKALKIFQKALPSNHPGFAAFYNNIGGVYNNMGEHSKALSYYEKALEIYQHSLPENHPDLAAFYNNIGGVYDNIGEYSKALSYYEEALKLNQKALPANHPNLATAYSNIGAMYNTLGKWKKAVSFYEKGLEICKKALPTNHHNLMIPYNNIGLVYSNMGEYSKAISNYEKVLEICKETRPENHRDFAMLYNNIGSVYEKMEDYLKALSYYECAVNILQRSAPANHPNLLSMRGSIEYVKKKL